MTKQSHSKQSVWSCPFLLPILAVGWIVLFSALSGCSSLSTAPQIPDRKADLFSVSMMGSARSGTGLLKVRTCSNRYLDVLFRWPVQPYRELEIQAVWSSGFDQNRGMEVLPLSARYRSEDGQGNFRTINLKGYVLFHNLATCAIARAVFVPSADGSVIEPKLFILDGKDFGRQDPWSPREIIFTGYRILLNESLTVIGPIPFEGENQPVRRPLLLTNGISQKNRELRGVDPPDFSGHLSMDLWFRGRPFQIHVVGDGSDGLFVASNPHIVGMGVLLPIVRPPYQFPEKRYRFALGGSLLVDGPVVMEGTIHFTRQTKEFSLMGHINQAGSILDPFRFYGHYRKGMLTRFKIPGEVDLPMEFNHRPMTLVLLPDANHGTYWIGSIDQNLFGVMDPVHGPVR
ncbi:MAG: hypothetical protein ACYC9S_00550 [Leptospirales bacterium]